MRTVSQNKTDLSHIDPDPDEDYITEEEDFDLEEENDLREIRVDGSSGEPDPEDEDLLQELEDEDPEDGDE